MVVFVVFKYCASYFKWRLIEVDKIKLIHPIYLDVPMLISFVAAIEGGIAFDKTISKTTGENMQQKSEVSAELSLKGMLSQFLGVSASAAAFGDSNSHASLVEAESRSHTESSLAIILYNKLIRDMDYIKSPKNIGEYMEVVPGDLIEIYGSIEKNSVDSLIDCISAISILSKMGSANRAVSSKGGKGESDKSQGLNIMKQALCDDRDRTPISNAILTCPELDCCKAIVTLRRENLRDLTLSELQKNSVRVVGKVTRVIQQDETMVSFENSGIAMVKPDVFESFLRFTSGVDNMNVKFPNAEISGPAVQVLPLMIFV